MTSCNAETFSCPDNKERKSMSPENNSLSEANFIDHDSTGRHASTKSASSEINACLVPSVNIISESDFTEPQCNVEQENPQKKKRQKGLHDSQSDFSMDSSAIKFSSTEIDVCLASKVKFDIESDLDKTQLSELSSSWKNRRPKKRGKRKMQEQSAPLINEKDCGTPKPAEMGTIEMEETNSIPQKQSGSVNLGTQISELGSSQKKRKRRKKRKKQKLECDKKQKLECDNKDEECGLQETADVDLIKMGEHTVISENGTVFPDAGVKLLELSSSQKKRKRKRERRKQKQRQGSDALKVDDAMDGSPEYGDLDSIKIEENSLISGKQSGSLSASTQVSDWMHDHNKIIINDKDHATVEVSGLDLVAAGENSLPSENQNGFLIASTTFVKKDNVDRGRDDSFPVDMEDFKASPKQEKFKTYQRKSRKPSGFLENRAEYIMVDQQASLQHPNETLSDKLSENNLERVPDVEHAASMKVIENVLVDEALSSCPNSNQQCVESKKTSEIESGCCDMEENMPQQSPFSLERSVSNPNKKLLILDINGLLADIVPYVPYGCTADIVVSRKSVFKRPFCDDFLQFCLGKFDVGVWSSRTKKNVDAVVEFLMGDHRHKLLFCWDQSHCTDTGVTTVENREKPLLLKELKKLWRSLKFKIPSRKYDESNTILLDDSPAKAIRNPLHTAIFPYSYNYKDGEDSSLGPGGDLRIYLEQLAEAENAQEFIARNPFGQRPITESNPSWRFYRRLMYKR